MCLPIFGVLWNLAWWMQAVGPNVVAVIPCGILTFVWSRTKFWPLDLLHAKLDNLIRAHQRHTDAINHVKKSLTQLNESHAELHRKVDGLIK